MKNGLIVNEYGSKVWYLKGKLHRSDGPAIILADGTQAWWLKGKLHRTDGPAVIDADGDWNWYLDGNEYPFGDYVNQLFPEDSPEKTLFILKWGES